MSSTVGSVIGAQTNFSIVPNGVVGSQISDRAFRVYVCLKAYVRPGNDTFPKLVTVAERFGMSESYLKRGISELKDAGILVVEKRLYSGGFRKVNCYYFPDISDGSTGSHGELSEGSDLTCPEGSSVTLPDGSDLLPPIEEEKQEEEKQEAGTDADAPASRKRASQISDNYTPSQKLLAWASSETPLVDVRLETAQFIDHHAAKGSTMKNWDRAWQTWMRNQQKWSKPKQSQQGPSPWEKEFHQ